MLARLRMLWVTVRDSLWFVPGVLTLLAAALALGITHVERSDSIVPEWEPLWAFAGSAEGARGVLSAIAGGLITVTGVVFSVTIVALQLASSQFTPRVLRNFTADRGNQTVLGVFIATFTYSILVLRTVRSTEDGQEPFVPRVAVTGAVVLVMVSIAFLIFFINHAARSIQAYTILDRVTRETLRDAHRLFPEHIGRPDEARVPDPWYPDGESAEVVAADSGYLQAVDSGSLFELGRRKDLVIGMEPHVGDFIYPGQALARVWPPGAVDREVVEGIRTAFVLGPERTPEQDVEFGIIELADIAVKALSPGINDPTTAIGCIDRLGEILLTLGTRDPPPIRRTKEGHVHYVARHTTLERAVNLAFGQIRHFGAQNPMIVKRMLDVLLRLASLVPEERRRPLFEQAEAIVRAVRADIADPEQVASVEAAMERMRA